MKHVLMQIAMLTSISFAQEQDIQCNLIYGLDFNGSSPDQHGLPLNNKANIAFAGATALTYNQPHGYFNYAPDISGPYSHEKQLYGHALNGKSFKLADATGIKGITSSRGFTISLVGAYVAPADWKNLLVFTYGGVQYQLQYSDSNRVSIFNGSNSVSTNLANRTDWYNFAISIEGSKMTLTVIDATGKIVGNETKDFGFPADARLTEVATAGERASKSRIDNFAIYDGVLELKHIKKIAAHSFAGKGLLQTLPEPVAAAAQVKEEVKYASPELLKLCAKGDLAAIKKLSSKDFHVNAISAQTANSLLMTACHSKNIELVRYLLDKGARLDASNPRGINALSVAVHTNNTEIAKLLLERGASIEHIYKNKGGEDFTALSYACKFSKAEMVDCLLEQGANPNARLKDSFYKTPLCAAIIRGDLKIVKLLVEKGARIDYIDTAIQDTPLAVAAKAGNTEIIQYMASQGANLFELTTQEYSLPYFVASSGNIKLMEYLLDNHLNLTDINIVIAAAEAGETKMLQWLIEHDASVIWLDVAFKAAARNGHLETVKYILEHEPRILNATRHETSALSSAISGGQEQVVAYLLEQGALCYEPHMQSAMRGGEIKIIELLEKHGLKLELTEAEVEKLFVSVFDRQIGNPKILTLLFKKGKDKKSISQDAINKKMQECLFILRQNHSENSYAMIKELLENELFAPNTILSTNNQFTALHMLALFIPEYDDLAYLLIKHGADTTIKSRAGHTALELAAEKSPIHRYLSNPKIKPLARKHEDTNTYNYPSSSTKNLFECIRSGKEDLAIKQFYQEGHVNRLYDIQRRNYHQGGTTRGETKASNLMLAAEHGMPRLLTLLLEKGADINTKNSYGEDALLLAVRNNHIDIVRILLERGANIHSRDDNKRSALILASEYASARMVELLLEKGANIQDISSRGTALHKAIARNHIGMIELLLKNNIKPDTQDEKGVRAKTLVRNITGFELLHKHSPFTQKELATALYSAIQKRDTIFARTIASHIEDFNQPAKTPYGLDIFLLNEATKTNSADIELVKTMLTKGASPSLSDTQYGKTPLFGCSKVEIAELLIAHGANVNHEDKNKETPLFHTYSDEGIDLLIKHGADINHCNKDGETALFGCSDMETLKSLISHKIDINKADNKGTTALMRLASSPYNAEHIKLLIDAGADANAKDEVGFSALQYAQSDEIIKLLQSHGAK